MHAGIVVAIVAGAIGLFILGVRIGRRRRERPDEVPPARQRQEPDEPPPARQRRFERGGAIELPVDEEWEARRNREVAEHYDKRSARQPH